MIRCNGDYRYVVFWINCLKTKKQLKSFIQHVSYLFGEGYLDINEHEWPRISQVMKGRIKLLPDTALSEMMKGL